MGAEIIEMGDGPEEHQERASVAGCPASTTATATPAAAEEVTPKTFEEYARAEWWQATFNLDVDRRCAWEQERFFDLWHRLNLTISAAAGSGAAAAYFSANTALGGVLAVMAALAAATDLGFAPARRAKAERQAYRASSSLLADLTEEGPPDTEEGLRRMRARKIRDETGATIRNETVWLLAREEACQAHKKAPGARIGRLRRALRHFVDWPG